MLQDRRLTTDHLAGTLAPSAEAPGSAAGRLFGVEWLDVLSSHRYLVAAVLLATFLAVVLTIWAPRLPP
jgi:hypothetical protein